MQLNLEGQTYRGFLITKTVRLEELKSDLIELVHEASGARVMHIGTDDPENLFCLSFQTLPENSNGVAHILEHTVLCGSEKFPVKDPFFSMTRRSLNTFMNAMTGQDFTCYPASSQVPKDFYNLMEVYLDAVFRPQLKRLSFLQEGHRFAFEEAQNPESRLQIQGVVYNEMKGAMSSCESRLWHHLFHLLLPDLPYAFNSGGDPKEIPSLTYEELIDFHRTFYHPSRCLFFFYGNLPLGRHLDFIAENVLEKTEKKLPLLPPLPLQKRFTDPVHGTFSYPIAPSESTEKKTVLALAWLTASISQQTDQLALCLLDALLTDTDVSFLKLALLKSGLCAEADSALDLEMSETPWVLICKGCDAKSAEPIAKLVFSTLEKFASEPIDPEQIEACLHQLEFERTEIAGEGGPFGLTLFSRAALAKQHGADPEASLLIHSLFADLRARLNDPDFLPGLLRKYILENPHFVLLTLHPDPLLSQKEKEAEEERLAATKMHLTPTQLQTILKQEKELAAFQEEIEHQSIECLPKVTLADVPPHARDFPLKEESFGNLQTLRHECFTNRILYADLVFDLPDVSFDDLPLLALFSRMLTEIGAGGRNYADMLDMQQATVGELIASLALHVQNDDCHKSRPTLSLRAKALDRNRQPLLELLQGIVSSPDFSDKERIGELLQEQATQLQNRLPKVSMNYAIQMALSGFSGPAAAYHQWQGLPFYQFITRLARKPDGSLIERLRQMQMQVLGAPHPTLVLSAGNEEWKHLSSLLGKWGESLPTNPTIPWKGQYVPSPVRAQGRMIGAPVAFTAYAFETVAIKDDDAAALLVSTELLKSVVLHKEIREKGGAYGSGASYSPMTGHFHFLSYRDPHLARTYDIFLQSIDRIGSNHFTERELEEAKLSVLQTLDAPIPPGGRATTAYSWHRAGRTYGLRDAFRKKVIGLSAGEVSHAVKKRLGSQKEKGVFVTFAGADLLKQEASKLPFPLAILSVDE